MVKFLWNGAIALWSCTLAFFVLSLLGGSHILSNMVGVAWVSTVVDGGFFILSAIFALLFWWIIPFPKSVTRDWDKNCGKNKELEHLPEPSEGKNVLVLVVLAYLPPLFFFYFSF